MSLVASARSAETMVAEGVDARIVLAMRNPDEIAASLAKRDGITRGYALLLWRRHIKAARVSVGYPRAICDYSRLLADWRDEVDRLGRALGLVWSDDDSAAIDAFLCKSDRHQRAGMASPADQDRLERTVHDLYRALLEIEGDSASWASLEPQLAEFEALERLLASALVEREVPSITLQAGLASRAEPMQELIAAHEQARMHEAKTELAESENLRAQAQLQAAESRWVEQIAQADLKDGEIQRLREELAVSAQTLAEGRRALAQSQQDSSEVRAELSQKQLTQAESERKQQQVLALRRWRKTAPLRWIAEKFRGGAHG